MLDVDIADQQYVREQIDALTSDAIEEGLVNHYFSDSRARTAISVTGGLLSYDSGTGIIGLASAQFTTIARNSLVVTGDLSYNPTTGVLSYAGPSAEVIQDTIAPMITGGTNNGITAVYDDANNAINFTVSYPTSDGITEGATNLYFNADRVRASLQGGDGVYYDQVSGSFSVNPFFAYVKITGHDTITADVASDSLTIVAGSGMIINTIPSQNTIVLSSTGGAGGSADPLSILSAAMIYGG
jgi:hypothetical protein